MVLHDGAAFDVLKWDIGASQPDPTGWVVPAVCSPDESKVPLAAEVAGWKCLSLKGNWEGCIAAYLEAPAF